MKKLVSLLAAFVLVCAMGTALAGCASDDASENFTGTWKVTDMVDSDGTDLTSTLELLDSLDLALVLYLNDDGSASFDMADQDTLTGTWEAASDTECTILFDDYSEITATLQDATTLVFEDSSQTMTCEKQTEE